MYYKVAPSCQVEGLDEIYQKYVGQIQDGAFVEVGAFDGISWSNTSCLAEHGWTGLLFEPVLGAFKKCRARYADNPRVQVIQCCIGNQIGFIETFPGGQLTTTSREQVEIYRALPWTASFHPAGRESLMSPVLTLGFALSIFGWEPGFEVLVIDTEGTELQVLEGFDIAHWRPQLAIVECHELHRDAPLGRDAQEINALFDGQGYEKVYADNINSIFVKC